MDSISTQDLVTPHKLCQYCTRMIDKAHCLRKTNSQLVPIGFDWMTEDDPVREVIEAYPRIQVIIDQGNQGCHLCSILTCLIFHGKSRAQVKQIFEMDESKVPTVYAVIKLLPYYWDAEAAFSLRLSKGTFPNDHRRLEGFAYKDVFFTTYKNEKVFSCRFCENCDRGVYSDEAAAREGRSHFRWLEYTGSDTSIELIEKWLEDCRKLHFACNVELAEERPTRLLDLTAGGIDGDIRLIPNVEAQNGRYATLSYCWGSEKPLVLQKEVFDTFRQGIKFSSLPKTFRDAVFVCRKLQIFYLWIDALCIIQNDPEDLNMEISKMTSVYMGSAVTIAAAQAESSRSGFLHSRSVLRQQHCRVLSDNKHTVLAKAFYSCRDHKNIPGRSKLDERGWVLQERFLSPRTLYFGTDGIHWECRKGILCEMFPSFTKDKPDGLDGTYELHDTRWDWNPNIKKFVEELHDLGVTPGWSTKQDIAFRDVWNTVVEIFSRKQLRFQADKLSAIAGFANFFQARRNFLASFGLWLPYLIEELLWRVDGECGYRNELAPSWAWASMSGTKIITRGNASRKWHEGAAVKVVSPPPYTTFSTLPLVCSVQPSIEMEGKVCHGYAARVDNGKITVIYPDSESNKFAKRGAYFIPDTPQHLKGSFSCLLMLITSYERATDDLKPRPDGTRSAFRIGLVLSPVNLSKNQYQRVGYFREEEATRGPDGGMFPASLEKSIVKIV